MVAHSAYLLVVSKGDWMAVSLVHQLVDETGLKSVACWEQKLVAG